MLDMWERWIQFHELNLKSEPEEAPVINLKDIIPKLTERWKSGESVKLINNDTAAIRIQDLKTDKNNNVTVLLIQYTDKNVTDPVFSHLETGKLRTEPKLEGEGVAVSAHVVISHAPLNGNVDSYRLLLEEVPGLGRSRIAPFLKSEFKVACADMFEFKDEGTGRLKKYLPSVEVLGDLSAKLADDLNTGSVLQGIELVQHKPGKTGFDEENYFTEVSRHIKLRPVLKSGNDIFNVLEKVRDLARKDGYDDIKVRYKLQKEKQKTATLGTSKEDIADILIVRDEKIKSEEVLGQCLEKISLGFAKKMITLMNDAKPRK